MSDDITRAEASAIADTLMGTPKRPTIHDLIDRVAANAPDKDDARDLPPSGDTAEGGELTSGCPDTSEPHNPWRRD